MRKMIAAYTKLDSVYPGYVNVSSEDDGSVVVTARSDPTKQDGIYICGHARDKGQPGRCTPGDAHCNNYCNLAPEKGPMADSAKACVQTFEGATAAVRLSPDEWADVLRQAQEH